MALSSSVLNILTNHFETVSMALLGVVSIHLILKRERRQKAAAKVLDKALKANMAEPLTLHPEIDPAKCLGCGSCTTACPEGDILQLIGHKAVLVAPTKCVGHGECERACPFDAISLVFGTKTRGVDIPRLTKDYETNAPGIYIAGELGGMGLIRNAVKQGHAAADHASKHLPVGGPETDADLLIVGAGPAGLAAALAAIAKKKSYICIEQNSFGGTVFNFPRQKIVMSYPARLPLVGTMKFPSHKVSKEDLLEYWADVRRKTGLTVREGVKLEGIEGTNGSFTVKTSAGPITAKKVILAMGVRGSPRRLGLPNEDLPKVTYNLLDPDQYQGRHIVVVGGGNAAVEAAQYLGAQRRRNHVTLVVRGKGFDRCNQENIDLIMKMNENKLVEIWFESAVKEIHEDSLMIMKGNVPVTIPNQFLFVFVGAEMPHKFLMSLGVEINKKFGESLGPAA